MRPLCFPAVHDNRELVEKRLQREFRERIVPSVHGAQVSFDVSAFHVGGEPVPWSVAEAAHYEPFAIGGRWGPPWSTTWFRFDGTVPSEWAGAEVEAIVDLGFSGMPGFQCEGLLWRDGVPVRGIAPEHRAILVAGKAEGGEPVHLHVEAAANPVFVASYQPNALGDRATAGTEPLYRLNQAALAIVHADVRELALDVRVLRGLMAGLPKDEPRRNLILRALERAFDQLDLHDVPATAAAARAELAEVLAQPAHASAHRITAVGHAHIDSAWLWPLRETRRKCARTFSTAVALMDDYPDYRFVCSQAQQYAWIEAEHPDLFRRIGDKVTAGQWVPVGSMWVESDCNLTSGESLVRQFVHGKRYFLEKFGVETKEVWLPDVFGYAGNLPQIMALAGCRWFLTQKLSWNQTNRFPHHTVRWEGIDGTRIFTHFPPADTYGGVMSARELLHAVHNFADHGYANSSLYPFGYGDGGGGPTREMLDLARRFADLEGAPRVEIGTPEAFFAAAEAEYPDAPVWR
jgi:alpha-mannosidase